jgi:hypothetical protein
LLAKYKWDFEVGRFGKTAVEGVQGEFLTYRGKLVLSDLDGIAMKGDVGSSVYRDPVLGDTNSKANALIEDKNSVAREVLGTKLVQHSDAALYRAEKVQSPKYRDLIAAEPGGKVFELNTVENAKSFFQKHGIQPNLKWEGWQKGLESNVKNFDLNPSPSVEEFIKTADTFEQKGAEQSYIDKTGPPGGGGFVESVKKPFLWARDLFVTQPRSDGEPFTPGSHDRNTILYGIDPLTLKAQKDLNDLSPERLHAVDRDDRKFQLIEVTKDGVVRDGHHRLKLAIQEGRAVDVIIVD